MDTFDQVIDLAKADPGHLALSDGDDFRVVQAAIRATRDGVARITLVGSWARIRDRISSEGGQTGKLHIEDPAQSPRLADYACKYRTLASSRDISELAAEEEMRDPLGYCAMMVRNADVDGTLGGATQTSAKTVRAALRIIGPADRTGLVSSFFLMGLNPGRPQKKIVAFADCAMVVAPDSAELARIAVATARSFRSLTAETPKVAMLSFSTKGSAGHERVATVARATDLARKLDPSLLIDGELQFDAAYVEAVGVVKNPTPTLRGSANVFIFPNLDAANIGYKIAERIGGAEAVGPILQGLARPANDLSRGCNAQDVYKMIAVTSLQSAKRRREICAALPV